MGDGEIVMFLAEIRNKRCRLESRSVWCVWFGHVELDMLLKEMSQKQWAIKSQPELREKFQ